MRIFRTLCFSLAWLLFLPWCLFTLYRTLLHVSSSFGPNLPPPAFPHPWPGLLAALTFLVPSVLFVWVNRRPERNRHALAAGAISLLALLVTEVLWHFADGYWTPPDFIIGQAVVILALFLLTRLHQHAPLSLEGSE